MHFSAQRRYSNTLLASVLLLGATLSLCRSAFAQEPKPKAEAPRDVRIAVGTFKRPIGTLSPADWVEWGGRLQDTLQEKLSALNVNVVERERLKEITSELSRAGDTVDAETAAHIGQLSGANYLLVGRTSFDVKSLVVTYRYSLTLNARLISLRTGKVVGTYDGKGEKSGNVLLSNNEKGMSRNRDAWYQQSGPRFV